MLLRPAILLVDDVKECADGLLLQLEPEFGDQFNLEVATSGPEALELIETSKANGEEYAIIISDLIMHGMHGDELLIRANELLPQAVKVLYTGCADARSLLNIIDHARLDYFFEKPWQEAEMLHVVKTAALYYSSSKLSPDDWGLLRSQHERSQKSLALAVDGAAYGTTETLKLHEGESRLVQLLELGNVYRSSAFEFVYIFLLQDNELELAKVFTNQGMRSYRFSEMETQDPAMLTYSLLERLKHRQEKHQMLVPISWEDKLLGYLLVENPQTKRAITSGDLDFLQQMANITATLAEHTDILQKAGW